LVSSIVEFDNVLIVVNVLLFKEYPSIINFNEPPIGILFFVWNWIVTVPRLLVWEGENVMEHEFKDAEVKLLKVFE
jgi:hypothetical protein